jgi:hypothetical protein
MPADTLLSSSQLRKPPKTTLRNLLTVTRQRLLSFRLVSLYLTSLSLFGIIHDSLRFGLSNLFASTLAYYNAFIGFVFQPLELVLVTILNMLKPILPFGFELIGEWRHAFVVMGIYFAADLRGSYIPRNLPWQATVSAAIFGLLVSLIFSVAGGYLGETKNPIWAILMPILGLSVYELLKAPFSASFVPIPSYSWLGTFSYYSLIYGVGDLILGAISTLLYLTSPWSSEPGAEVIVLIIFLLLLAMRNFIAAWIKLYIVPLEKEVSRSTTYVRSGSVRLAINLLYALILLFSYVLINGYLSSQGM